MPQSKKTIESKPRLGEGRARIRHEKPQPDDGIPASSKSCEIAKMPMTQNVTQDRIDFLEQLITNKTEAFTRGMVQDKNRELTFYPDLIHRPSPRPPENL